MERICCCPVHVCISLLHGNRAALNSFGKNRCLLIMEINESVQASYAETRVLPAWKMPLRSMLSSSRLGLVFMLLPSVRAWRVLWKFSDVQVC
jgi:hypothetical protein